MSFFNRLDVGIAVLKRAIDYVRKIVPYAPIILDYKTGDTLEVNKEIAYFAFQELEVDAITVNPYFGREVCEPFLSRKDKGVIVLCRTSNEGAGEFQDIKSNQDGNSSELPFYMQVAWRVSQYWNKNHNCALIMGARYPEELSQVRHMITQRDLLTVAPFFVQGIGTPDKDDVEGNITQAVENGKDRKNVGFAIISSRAIIYASNGPDFATAANASITRFNELVEQCRN